MLSLRLRLLILFLPVSALAQTAELSITSFPPGASVSIDRVAMKDKDNSSPVTPLNVNLSLGPHIVHIGLNDPGWQPYDSTINIIKADNDLSVVLLPVVQTGPQGPMGLAGLAATIQIGSVTTALPGTQASVANTGTPNAAVLSFVLPQGVTGAPSIIPGPPGPAGPAGPAGTQGPAGAPAMPIFAGIWSLSVTYSIGQEVMRDPTAGGSRGPFFNLTGATGSDPAGDTVNWVYCCGTAVLGYAPLLTAGSTAGMFSAGSTTSLSDYTFNVWEAKSISSLTITTNFQLSTTQRVQCFISNPANQGPPPSGIGLPDCNQIGATNLVFLSSDSVLGFNFDLYNGTVTTQGPPAGTITWTVFKNGVATPLTISTASNGTFTSTIVNNGTISFGNGDTLALQINNPSMVTDTLATGSTWSIN